MFDAGATASAALVLGALGAALGVLAGAWLGRRFVGRAPGGPGVALLAREAEALVAQARAAGEPERRSAEIAAREEAVVRRAASRREGQQADERLAKQALELARRESDLAAEAAELERAGRCLRDRGRPLAEGEAERRRHLEVMAGARAETRARLERVGGARAEALRSALAEVEVEAARLDAAQLVRQVDLPARELGRRADRVLAIAVGRFSEHYLTERNPSLVPLPPPRDGHPAVSPGELQAIEGATGVKLPIGEGGDVVRLDGLDGLGREAARRSLGRLLAGGSPAAPRRSPGRPARWWPSWSRTPAPSAPGPSTSSEIAPAHPDLMALVGRLNWRTSYTQNQWKHAVEVAFLCGMMADELDLDRAIARRAALLHDIGKALTHELDGSHAVIGAEYARRLGEPELVANAIGAHHADEPFASPYAYLVAAADAMSGARPGARRHMEDNYLARISELERISRDFPGVAEAFAVQGGREVRVVVREAVVDDLGAVELSASIAREITRRLTFPGQIRVTVIRELKAIARTGSGT